MLSCGCQRGWSQSSAHRLAPTQPNLPVSHSLEEEPLAR
ncbi:MAG: hypothetical protein OJF49_001974 [Ktedonobacterales bacterium]|nr:MAG: hypothetical protein OJF49_001974 [Ktedonobacterales bacterium]